ncbi:hypothetical protein NLJ89_g10762 [Agrocybe chaxingu]|uniref:ABC transporter domain-containing protein n=1 Tax=Agrocybe chaxingu TaxID=84603 RepID=A0A9W8JN91_9AGAR|nr:hypothetical protein NLJ89_g10762 [Agrocybe chaxingu]
MAFRSTSTNVTHSKLGVWDIYEDPTTLPRKRWPSIEAYAIIKTAAPYVARMLRDIASIRECWLLLAGWVSVELVASLVPAVALSFHGQLLTVVQTAVDHRTVDPHLLFTVAAGGLACSLATRLLRYARARISAPLHRRIKSYYAVHIFHAVVRLDVPTYDDPAVQHQLEQAFPKSPHSTIAFDAVSATLRLFSTAIQLTSQLSVLVSVLSNQPDGPLLVLLCLAHAFFQWAKVDKPFIGHGVWAATTTDPDYIKSEGLKRAVTNPIHRKEIVASGIAPSLLAQYRQAVARIADRAGDFYEVVASATTLRDGLSINVFIQEVLRSMPEIAFALRAVQKPSSIPLSLASLNLITQTTQGFTYTAFSLFDDTVTIANKLAAVRHLYEVTKIPNRVKVHVPKKDSIVEEDDPSLGVPFPEDQQSLELGVSIEFRNVSFKYPGSDDYALRNLNFKIEQGQLCVIVGSNGSGKSTILKLIARLYDPTDGQILVNGADIRSLRLADLRRAISVLFQDYTLFPLSIRDNIALGDPEHVDDLDKIRRAAELGGADGLVERLPDKYDTYLERPVRDYYSTLPEGMTDLFGRPVDYGRMQRIALSRTFMRSVVSDNSVGLLLFDEPSASLDPTAEHDLFERLRKLRGSKTMIFSSHRFGNLTRHADLILYMNDAEVLEEGTHEQLLAQNGGYAQIWMLQARAFLS